MLTCLDHEKFLDRWDAEILLGHTLKAGALWFTFYTDAVRLQVIQEAVSYGSYMVLM